MDASSDGPWMIVAESSGGCSSSKAEVGGCSSSGVGDCFSPKVLHEYLYFSIVENGA